MITHLRNIIRLAAGLPKAIHEDRRIESAAQQMADVMIQSGYSGDVGIATTMLFKKHKSEFTQSEREQMGAIRARACRIVYERRKS